MKAMLVATALVMIGSTAIRAEDWPEYRGRGRQGIWNETGIIEKLPEGGLTVLWRTPVKAGFSGPAVANGRVFVTDFDQSGSSRGIERVLALDEKTGRVLWTHEWPVDYSRAKISNMNHGGPGTTPTVDGDRVYVLGRTGVLVALNVKTGEILWTKDYIKDYKTELDPWGAASAPIVEGNLLIALVGGEPGARVVAFDKVTGKEIWRAISFEGMHGTAPPILINAGGTRQLIIWHPWAVVSLNPATGQIYWEVPFEAYQGTNPAPPVYSPPYLLISNFTFGSMLMKLDDKKPAATMVWKGKGSNEIDTDGLHALMSQPIIKDGHIYGICSFGQLRCLRLDTGERVWETQVVTAERARFATAHIVRNGDRFFITNDHGELMIARLTPEGYQEISRMQLIKPTMEPYNRRQLGVITWAHPAYANRNLYVRNDEEIICFSLAAGQTAPSRSR